MSFRQRARHDWKLKANNQVYFWCSSTKGFSKQNYSVKYFEFIFNFWKETYGDGEID